MVINAWKNLLSYLKDKKLVKINSIEKVKRSEYSWKNAWKTTQLNAGGSFNFFLYYYHSYLPFIVICHYFLTELLQLYIFISTYEIYKKFPIIHQNNTFNYNFWLIVTHLFFQPTETGWIAWELIHLYNIYIMIWRMETSSSSYMTL